MPLFYFCYAGMVAADGISYYTVARSKDIRLGLVARGSKPVSSPNTVRTKVLNFAKLVREKIKDEISELLSSKQFFTVTMDGWTSVANKKYANINIHTKGKFFNLGLIRMNGSAPAEVCFDILSKTLAESGISLNEDVVSVTTDGAAVMKKMGKACYFEFNDRF